jgi:hypothetical protein
MYSAHAQWYASIPCANAATIARRLIGGSSLRAGRSRRRVDTVPFDRCSAYVGY